MSVLLPETVKVLRSVRGERMIRPDVDGVSAADRFADVRKWMASRAHVAWCQCVTCKARRQLVEAGELSAQLREQLAHTETP